MKFLSIVCLAALSTWAHAIEPNGPLRGSVKNATHSIAPSIAPSFVPTVAPSDTPSDEPSDTPSNAPSDYPSIAPSDFPSAFPSTQPSKEGTIFEDTVQKGLEELNLIGFADVQQVNSDFLIDSLGTKYPLAQLQPYTEVFSPGSYSFSEDGATAKHMASNETFRVPIFRAVFDNNTVVQVATTDEGSVSFAEIRGPIPKHDTFFIQEAFASSLLVQEDETGVKPTGALLSFTTSDIDKEKLAASFSLGEPQPLKRRLRELELTDSDVPIDINRTNFDPVSAACQSFTVVNVAVVYDSEFCGAMGSPSAARSKIVAIIASASILYERGLCVKLQLTDMYTPDATCGGRSGTFGGFDKENICSTGGLIYDFANYMAPKRNSIGIDKNAIVHLFTGIPKLSRTIGCAFTGGVRAKPQCMPVCYIW